MVNAQQWLEQNYPANGTCINKDDKENYGKRREEIINLDISNRNLSGSLNSKGWTNLRKMNFSFNQLTGGDVGRDNWPVMEELDWSYNQFGKGGYVWGVHLFPQLRKLNLSNNIIQMLDLSKANQLTHLNVSNNLNLGGVYLSSGELVELDCSNNSALTTLSLPNFSNLKFFDIRGTNITEMNVISSSPASPTSSIPVTTTTIFATINGSVNNSHSLIPGLIAGIVSETFLAIAIVLCVRANYTGKWKIWK